MIIVSPSGNLYGSEQVLIDYLQTSKQSNSVYVPKKSLLLKKLKSLNQHKISEYNVNGLKFLYINILFQLSLNKSHKLYINEGGHIRYVKLLAKILKHKKIFVHIRILEDAKKNRLGNLPSNIKLITVSNFMLHNLRSYKCFMIYDPYPFADKEINLSIQSDKFSIGIVGRITKTKGYYLIEKFIKKINSTYKSQRLNFIFFGNVSDDVKNSFEKLRAKYHNVIYNGFIAEKDAIYNNLDILLHFNSNESLGRIILESIDYNKPFICSAEGGTGEIAKLVGLEELTINFYNINWQEELVYKIEGLINNYKFYASKVREAKLKARNIFSINNYVSKLESIFEK